MCRISENATAPAVRPSFPPALPPCCVAFNLWHLLCARTVLIRRLFQLGWAPVAEDLVQLCWLQKMERNCDGHGDPSQQHPGCRQCTDGEARQQRRLYDVQQTPAVEGNSKRRRLTFQNKAAEAEDSPSQRTRRAFLRSRTRREILVREWGKLGSAIRRAAAVCLTPSTGADEDDELDLPYVQLHKVTRAVRREAFGPLYLVT